MKKNIKKNLFSIVIASVILAIIILLSRETELFASVGDVVGKITVSGEKLISIVLAIAIVIIISNLILVVLSLFSEKHGRVGTLATVFSSLIKYIAVMVAFCWILSIIGVNVSTIFASVGIVALILGFGAESLVADLVTGVFILFENQYNVGDIIEVEGFRGKVQEIGIRTICLEDSGGNIKIINNSDLKNIVNRSNHQSVAVCDVGISYDTDLEVLEKKLEKILEEIKEKNADIFTGKVRYVGVEALADSAVVIRIVADVAEADIFNGKRVLNKEIKIAFDKAHISIPYPQLDVHNK